MVNGGSRLLLLTLHCESFIPKVMGRYKMLDLPIDEMASVEVILQCLTSVRQVFGPSIFSIPNFEDGYRG